MKELIAAVRSELVADKHGRGLARAPACSESRDQGQVQTEIAATQGNEKQNVLSGMQSKETRKRIGKLQVGKNQTWARVE